MKTWTQISERLGRNDMPAALVQSFMDGLLLEPAELAAGISDAWTLAEFPEQIMDAELWVYLFDQAGFIVDGEVRPDSDKPELITLWRGAPDDRKAGMAWTDDKDRAVWFANRFAGAFGDRGGNLYEITATASMILANFNEARGEREWVLDPAEFMEDDISLVVYVKGGKK